ncbi:MAG: AraC family transcriptional regulator [Sphingomonadaceae bacterium]
MPSPVFALPVQYIRQIADQVNRMGVAMPASFLRHKWNEIALDDTSYTLTIEDFQQLVLDALAATGEPAFGLLVGARMMVNSHGILGYAAMNSGTIGQAMELLQNYIQIRTRLVAIRHQMAGDEVRFTFEEGIPLGAVQQPVLEAVVLTIKNLFDFLTGGVSQVLYVALPFAAPSYAALAEEMFRCEVRYASSWTGFAFARAMVEAPLAMANPTTLRETLLICQRELEKVAHQQSWRMRIRRLLLEERHGVLSLNVAARLFNLTPRTLHRRLLEEGSSYSAVVDEVRHMLALEHLKAGKLSLQEIAYALGYTDQSNFRRAFKRWEGMTPSACQLRYQQAGGFTASIAPSP